jgi:hypothetical protein
LVEKETALLLQSAVKENVQCSMLNDKCPSVPGARRSFVFHYELVEKETALLLQSAVKENVQCSMLNDKCPSVPGARAAEINGSA